MIARPVTVTAAAQDMLPALAGKFFKKGRKAVKRGDLETLHEFRIAAKRFRYALELFAPLYGPSFDQRLRQLKKLQDDLGQLNDIATTRTLTSGQPVNSFLEARETEVRQSFAKHWEAAFASEVAQARWLRYLARPQGATPPRRRSLPRKSAKLDAPEAPL